MLKLMKQHLLTLATLIVLLVTLNGCASPAPSTTANSDSSPTVEAAQEQATPQESSTAPPSSEATADSDSGTAATDGSSPSVEAANPSAKSTEATGENPAKGQTTPKPSKAPVQATTTPAPLQTEAPTAKPTQPPAVTPVASTVTISITGDADSGTILAASTVKLDKNDTVLDILKQVTRSNKIQMEFSGRGATAYIEGINNLYEFDKGAESGWMYRVNGDFPNKSAGVYKLTAGDVIEWLYTEDLGKDLGASFE